MAPAKKRPPGEFCRSQVLTTYGPGSMVDLPNHSVVIGGLNYWSEAGRKTIEEERLAAKVANLLGVASIELCTPPSDTPDPDAPRTGITAFAFPTWFLAQVNSSYTYGGREYRTRLWCLPVNCSTVAGVTSRMDARKYRSYPCASCAPGSTATWPTSTGRRS